jgi:hypothetical protein
VSASIAVVGLMTVVAGALVLMAVAVVGEVDLDGVLRPLPISPFSPHLMPVLF